MPPEDRFVPRFAAEPPQELLPYGRWAQTLQRRSSSRACLRIDSEGEDLGEPGEIRWYPRPHLARAHVRARRPRGPPTATSSTATSASRPAATARSPSDFHAVADFTAETAEANPDWQIDLCDEVDRHAGAASRARPPR